MDSVNVDELSELGAALRQFGVGYALQALWAKLLYTE